MFGIWWGGDPPICPILHKIQVQDGCSFSWYMFLIFLSQKNIGYIFIKNASTSVLIITVTTFVEINRSRKSMKIRELGKFYNLKQELTKKKNKSAYWHGKFRLNENVEK